MEENKKIIDNAMTCLIVATLVFILLCVMSIF